MDLLILIQLISGFQTFFPVHKLLFLITHNFIIKEKLISTTIIKVSGFKKLNCILMMRSKKRMRIRRINRSAILVWYYYLYLLMILLLMGVSE